MSYDSDTRSALAAVAADWMARRNRPLPDPCPADPQVCADWWAQRMQEPRVEFHARDYANRLRHTLGLFLGLSDADRAVLHAGVTEDRVPWRGETMTVYTQHWEHTQELRRDGPEAFFAHHRRTLARYGLHPPTGNADHDELD